MGYSTTPSTLSRVSASSSLTTIDQVVGGAPRGLRVEHLDEPLGVRAAAPRLSWRLPDGAREQRGYRITTDNGWDTGMISGTQNLLVPYAGPRLESAQRVTWQVMVTTDLGASSWSEPGWFETGLLTPEDWRASWIEPGQDPTGPSGDRPAALLRVEFDVHRPVSGARLHATAKGIYEAFVNGERAGDAELMPGFTQYDVRLQVQTIDVTDSVRLGRNALAVVLSDGWFRGQVGITRASDQWGSRSALLAELRLVHDDGSVSIVGTGDGWRSSTGHVLAADLIAGQRVDYIRLQRGWETVGFDDSAGIIAVALVIAAATQSLSGFLIAWLVLTVGQAIYLTVDIAIAADVVPDDAQAGKAMSVYQVATLLPNVGAPIVAIAVLTISGGTNYSAFFLVLAVLAVFSALAALRIRRIRRVCTGRLHDQVLWPEGVAEQHSRAKEVDHRGLSGWECHGDRGPTAG